MKDYKIDFTAQVITVSAECAKRMNDPSSPEYAEIHKICSDFPGMKIKRRTHRTPGKYTSKATGEKFNCNPFKNLTYKNMEGFINGLSNSEKYRKPYDFLKNYGNLPLTSRYAAVRRWFVNQFPKFRSDPLFYLYNDVSVIDYIPYLEMAQQETEGEASAERQGKSA